MNWKPKPLMRIMIPLMLMYTTALSQGITSSPYSAYGVGLIKLRTSAYNRSMASTGVGVISDRNLNLLNPASFTYISGPSQITELGMYYGSGRMRTADASESTSDGGMNAINLWFRFNSRWSATVGLAPFSTVNYAINTTPDTGDGSDSQVLNTGTGGLNQYYFSNGFRLTKRISVGGSLKLISGNIRKKETLNSGDGAGLIVESKTIARQVSWDAGIIYNQPLSKSRSVSFGATFSPRVTLNTRRQFTVYQSYGDDTLFTENASIEDYKLPSTVGVGLALNSKRSSVAFDYRLSGWKTGYLGDETRLRQSQRISLGYNYKGNPNGETYLDIIEFSTGVYVEENYLVLRNRRFNDWGFSIGAGFPFNLGRSSINLSYNYSGTGTTVSPLLSQTAGMITIDVILRDLWQRRRIAD